MLAALAPLLLSFAPAPAQESPQGDAVVLWSAGLEAIAPDERDAGFVDALLGLENILTTIGESLETPMPVGPRLASRWAQRPFDLRFGLTDEGRPRVHFLVEFDSLEEAEGEALELRDFFSESGVELNTSGDSPSSYWSTTPEGPMAVTAAARGESGAVVITVNHRPDAGLARPSVRALGTRAPVYVGSYDGSQLLVGLRALAAREDAGEPEAVHKSSIVFTVLEHLDLVGESTPKRTWAVSHGDAESLTISHVEGWANSFSGRRGASLVQRTDVALVPEDAVWAWMGNVHPTILTEIANAIEPQQVAQGLAMAKAMTGVDLEQDFLANIGPLCGAYAAGSTGASALTGLVLFARSDDADAVVDSLETLIESIPVPPEERPFVVDSWEHGSRFCTSLAFPGLPVPVEPSFCAADGVVFLAMGRNALRQALDQLEGETSLLDHPRFAKLSERVFKDLVGFSFLDSPVCVQKGYGTLSMVLTGLSNAGRGHGAPDLSGLLPTGSKLAKGMRPTLSLSYLRGEDLLTVKAHDRSWIARTCAALGSPVGELNPMVASMAASVAIPNLLSARLSANEAAAIASLRAIASAQAQFRHQALIDADGDATGEYGLLGELSGAYDLRGAGAPIEIPVLSAAFGELSESPAGGAVATRSGYHFQVWVPGRSGAVSDGSSGPSGPVDAEGAQERWCAYAWPVKSGSTGGRAFYVNQEGDLWFVGIGSYSGLEAVPTFDAASLEPGSFETGTDSPGEASVDGNSWMIVD